MGQLVMKRLAAVPAVLLVVTVVTFALIHLTPGDPATVVAGETASPADIARIREQLGLNEPLVSQYAAFVGDLVQFDFGKSLLTNESVSARLAETLPVTLAIASIALLLALFVGLAAGIASTIWVQRWPDRLITSVASLAIAAPPFVVALCLVVPFAVNRPWLPATGYVSFSDDKLEWVKHLMLPCLALSLVPAAEIARQFRAAMLDVLEQDFMRTIRAKGVSNIALFVKHGMRNASIPVLTVIGLQTGRLVGGAVVVERIFAIPGFGSMGFDGVLQNDYPVVISVVLVSSLIVLAVNLLVDLSTAAANPKLRDA